MRSQAGFTLLETVLALAIALPLGLALLGLFGAGIRGANAATTLGAQRHALATFVERLDAEAHGAAAIFTPANDVLGQTACDPNGICRELDFFTRDAQGTARFWAYRYDPSSRSLTRYAYDDLNTGGPVNARPSGIGVSNVASFGVQRIPISLVTIPALGSYAPQDVVVPFGYPGVAGGNALVVVDVSNGASHLRHELAPRLTATGFSVVVGTYAPPAVATPVATPASTPGQSRFYALLTATRLGTCIGGLNGEPGCTQNDPNLGLPFQREVDLEIAGTLVAPLDSQIRLADVCQTQTGSNPNAQALVAMIDITGRVYAQVTDIALGSSELWLVADPSSAYVAPALPVHAAGGADPNPFAGSNPRGRFSTEFVVAC